MKRERVVCGWKISLGKFASLLHYLELSWGQIPHSIERKAALAPEPSHRNVSLRSPLLSVSSSPPPVLSTTLVQLGIVGMRNTADSACIN